MRKKRQKLCIPRKGQRRKAQEQVVPSIPVVLDEQVPQQPQPSNTDCATVPVKKPMKKRKQLCLPRKGHRCSTTKPVSLPVSTQPTSSSPNSVLVTADMDSPNSVIPGPASSFPISTDSLYQVSCDSPGVVSTDSLEPVSPEPVKSDCSKPNSLAPINSDSPELVSLEPDRTEPVSLEPDRTEPLSLEPDSLEPFSLEPVIVYGTEPLSPESVSLHHPDPVRPGLVCPDSSSSDPVCPNVVSLDSLFSDQISLDGVSSDTVNDSVTSFHCEVTNLSSQLKDFVLMCQNEDKAVFANIYHDGVTTIKFSVSWYANHSVTLFVHDKEVPPNHNFWAGLPDCFDNVSKMSDLFTKLAGCAVCVGNPDEDMVGMMENQTISGSQVFRHDYHAVSGSLRYSTTLRHEHCTLLTSGLRCAPCQKARSSLRSRRARRLSQEGKTSKCKANSLLTHDEKKEKLKELAKAKKSLKRKVSLLEEKILVMKEKASVLIESEGECLNSADSSDISDIINDNKSEIDSMPEDSFQKILFEQQLRYNSLKNKASMRWHPAVVRWCLYIRSKSSKAYDGLRSCLALPSQRTLYDYSNYTESGTGFNVLVTEQLIDKAEKDGLFDEEHKMYVGIIQDEVRIKQDLVYNKHTGELVGYIDLDNVSNELLNIEEVLQQSERKLAKYMLVVMVRGICSGLQYPLAAFATEGINSEFLYPIIWEAIEIVQTVVGLEVLFICCDGASPNRKFFTLHSATRDKNTYKVDNPYSDNQIYFISDAPHLLKTARNCFANSFAHKQSRHLWNGDTISWRDIRQLFEDHWSGRYRMCNLKPEHVFLTSFSIMKVNLAAQVLSKTVADALEFVYGDRVAATVKFIRLMNKWFDVMNTRNLNEGRRKRNPDVDPFTSVDDPRFDWLLNEFLPYFDQWENRVNATYHHLPKCERDAKLLSHQTCTGLRITTRSIVECSKFLLTRGADFVLTEHFNQDPLERHFSHYRQKGGANENPSVFEICHLMNQVRAVSTQVVAPRRGNVQGNVLAQLDNTPLPRRKKQRP